MSLSQFFPSPKSSLDSFREQEVYHIGDARARDESAQQSSCGPSSILCYDTEMPVLPSALMSELRSAFSDHQISDDLAVRYEHARDLWSRGLLEKIVGEPPSAPPELVMWPNTAGEIASMVRLCAKHRISIVPFGAGSGVCGGVSGHGGVTINLQRLNRIVSIDPDRKQVICEAGVLGSHLESALSQYGLTLGHFPSSIICSTVGGWVATRGAGQCSTRYGTIEDMVQDIQYVSSQGEILTASRAGSGVRSSSLLLGSEGAFGIITQVTLAVRSLPTYRSIRAFSFPTLSSGTSAIADLLQSGVTPTIIRLYDELDSLLSLSHKWLRSDETPSQTEALFQEPLGKILQKLTPRSSPVSSPILRLVLKTLFRCERLSSLALQGVSFLSSRIPVRSVLILGFEGNPTEATAQEQRAIELLQTHQAIDEGKNLAKHWEQHRYELGFKLPSIFASGLWVDTMEVATTYSGLLPLYRNVKQALSAYGLVLAHFSHAYREGCSIYFTIISPRKTALSQRPHTSSSKDFLDEDQARYDRMWNKAMSVVAASGGTISHHHGVGKLKSNFLNKEWGPSLSFLSSIKTIFDPIHVFSSHLCNSVVPSSFRQTPTIATTHPEPLRIHPKDLLCDADTSLSIHEIETRLQHKGFSLGPIHPWSTARSLKDVLNHPLPSEAFPITGTFFQRCFQLTIHSNKEGPMTLPTHLSPKRATGPDLKSYALTQGELQRATIGILKVPCQIQTLRFVFQDRHPGLTALLAIRDMYDAIGPYHLAWMEEPSESQETPRYVLIVSIASFYGPIQDQEIYAVRKVCAEHHGQEDSEAAVLQPRSPFDKAPIQEKWIPSPSVTDLEEALLTMPGPKQLTGVHLHGVTLCCHEASTPHGSSRRKLDLF